MKTFLATELIALAETAHPFYDLFSVNLQGQCDYAM